jgi:hypothetical protein
MACGCGGESRHLGSRTVGMHVKEARCRVCGWGTGAGHLGSRTVGMCVENDGSVCARGKHRVRRLQGA